MKKLILISALLLVACDNKGDIAACVRYNHDKAVNHYTRPSKQYDELMGAWKKGATYTMESESSARRRAEKKIDNSNIDLVIKKNCSKNINYVWRP